MGLFGRRRKRGKRILANLAIESITGGLMGDNSQESYQDNVMSSLDNITEQLGSIGATSPQDSSVSGGVADAINTAAVDPTEVEESTMGDDNPTSVSSALLKRYKGSCKMKLKNK